MTACPDPACCELVCTELVECVEPAEGSPFPGAVMTTRLAPAVMCACAFSASVKKPVYSITISTSTLFHGICAGSFSANSLISFPSITIAPSFVETSEGKRPYTESYFKRYAKLSGDERSLIATTSIPVLPCAPRTCSEYIARTNPLPILPKPLTAIFFMRAFYHPWLHLRPVYKHPQGFTLWV